MAPEQKNLGYRDTPFIPGTRYRVHDGARPQPRIVTPGTASTQERAGRAPSDAILLFDGTTLDKWTSMDGSPARWKLENGYMEVVPKTGNLRTRAEFGDCQLHLEWAAPTLVKGESQGRGNSGVFLMGLYEVQVLDCFDNPTYPDGTTAALYGQYPPLVNACRRPGEWQCFDIVWEAHRFDGDRLLRPARITAFFNGVLIHLRSQLRGRTTYKQLTDYSQPLPNTGPLKLQNHGGDRVRFRNIWYRPLELGERD